MIVARLEDACGKHHSEMGEEECLPAQGLLRAGWGALLSESLWALMLCLPKGPTEAHSWALFSLVIHSFNEYKPNTAAPCQMLGWVLGIQGLAKAQSLTLVRWETEILNDSRSEKEFFLKIFRPILEWEG